MSEGAYQFKKVGNDVDFSLVPKQGVQVPREQSQHCSNVYKLKNAMGLLRRAGKLQESNYEHFMRRLGNAAKSGCVNDILDAEGSVAALGEIGADLAREAGRPVRNLYLRNAVIAAMIGCGLGGLVEIGLRALSGPTGYGVVVVGSMIGALLSVAVALREVSLDALDQYLDYGFEPFYRMFFVAVIASVFAFLLEIKFITFGLAGFDLANFTTQWKIALLLGLVSGIAEKAVSAKVIERAQGVFGNSTKQA